MPLVPMATPNGPRIKELRKLLGYTQAELGQKIGRTYKTVKNAEDGRRVSNAVITRLARALSTEPGGITLPEAPEPETATTLQAGAA